MPWTDTHSIMLFFFVSLTTVLSHSFPCILHILQFFVKKIAYYLLLIIQIVIGFWSFHWCNFCVCVRLGLVVVFTLATIIKSSLDVDKWQRWWSWWWRGYLATNFTLWIYMISLDVNDTDILVNWKPLSSLMAFTINFSKLLFLAFRILDWFINAFLRKIPCCHIPSSIQA